MIKCPPQDIFHENEIFLKRLYIKHTNVCYTTENNGQTWQERSAKYTIFLKRLYIKDKNVCYGTENNGQIWRERGAKYTCLYNLVQNICHVL
jgi:hypothetical protein